MMKEQLDIISGLDSSSYLLWLESNDRYYHHRKQLLADANQLFLSQRKLSELSDGERCVILGRRTRMADDAEYDVNLFGSPGGSGYVNGILSSGYVHLDPFFEAIPRTGKIDDETFERLVELYKQGISDSGSTVQLFVFFTRILAVVRPDTFVSGADGLVHKISKALGIRNPGNDYKKYWTDFLPRLHELNLFSRLVGDPINVNLALIDGIGWQETDGNDVGGKKGTKKIVLETSNGHSPLNQILYGPPGTGKTYHTIEAAVKAAEPDFVWKSRSEVKAKYDELINDKRIRFVTFHQSYGYEEFVEGLKAETDGEHLQYKVEPGVFRRLADSARAKRVSKIERSSSYSLDGRKIWKMSLGNTQTDEGEMVYSECLENDYILLGYGGNIDFSGCNSTGKIKEKFLDAGYELKPQDYNVTAVNTLVNKMSEGDLVVVSDGNHKFKAIAEITSAYECIKDDRDWYFQKRDVKWLMTCDEPRPIDELFSTALSQMTLYNLKDSVISREKLSALLNESKQELEVAKNHVLVIDEINRGNISKIFGELITLIEPSKRAGGEESIELILPHSHEPFTVPSNLYIIGTMNTADRSLAMMDTALRRRFDFVEMMPEPNLFNNHEVKGIDLTQLLDALNKRIEVLYDREHTLGHAFLYPAYNESDEKVAFDLLQAAFRTKIIPLLEEYFYEDWNKIRLVLGDNQKDDSMKLVRESRESYDDIFGTGHGLDTYAEDSIRYSLIPFEKGSLWEEVDTYKAIYDPKLTASKQMVANSDAE
ncbi:AAA family ATPase [Vibrio parahaemolyticus]|uniref:AAA family ATPase n=1 Tax=Vibrio parahaemolyticus TaxID=670 RepID=UPI002151459B|nr:AAA family ATPase [Vibrio parahaemolyticus]